MPYIDNSIIVHFLCTHKLDSTKVDFDPYLMEKDLIFYPVHKQKYPTHGEGLDRYTQRMKFLFTPFREQN